MVLQIKIKRLDMKQNTREDGLPEYVLIGNAGTFKKVKLNEGINLFKADKFYAQKKKSITNTAIWNLGYTPLIWWDKNLNLAPKGHIEDDLYNYIQERVEVC